MTDLYYSQRYMMLSRPLLNKKALYSDETEMFLTPNEPDPGTVVTVRFRTARDNTDEVWLVLHDEKIRLHSAFIKNDFEYYETSLKVGTETLSYYFEIHLGNVTCYYNKLGVCQDPQRAYAFHIVPGFHTPDWAKGAVMYQIFVDRFRNGDPSNDVETDEYSYIQQHVRRIENWNAPVQNMDVRNFYGGDLQGVIDKLDYLQELGIQAIYLNPIFVSPSNHKYDCQDYDYVDPHFGKILVQKEGKLAEWDQDNTHAEEYISRVTSYDNLEESNALFIRLVEEAHKRHIRIILDGVLNHCGSFNKWMDRERIYENRPGFEKGAYDAWESPYHDYFKFFDDSWPYNDNYDGWWGHKTLPKLNYEASRRLQEDIFRIGRKWVSPPYNADGWRLDVAADLGHSPEFNHRFWKEFRENVKKANPNAIILAEHYGDASDWLQGDQWDTVMNYDAFMEPVSWFFTGMEKHSDGYREDLLGNADSFYDAMRYHMASFHMQSLLTAMNELDNHDHSRFLTRTNHYVGRLENAGKEAADSNVDKAVMREAVVVQMTWPGAPTVYYGDEAGVTGFTDPDNRRTYPWGMEDYEMVAFYRDIIHLHNAHPVLRTGSVKMIYRDFNIFAYTRFDWNEEIVVVVNNRKEEASVNLPVWISGLSRNSVRNVNLTWIFHCDQSGFRMPDTPVTSESGSLHLILEPESADIFCHEERRKSRGKIPSGTNEKKSSGKKDFPWEVNSGKRGAPSYPHENERSQRGKNDGGWSHPHNRKRLQTIRK